jgi:3'-phosphoadenosine 5'-phosphosulfate (PAPS) 3'-phosphatase
MTETIELLRRASAYIAASVKTDADGEPVTESDHAAHDFACELAHAADRLAKTIEAEA